MTLPEIELGKLLEPKKLKKLLKLEKGRSYLRFSWLLPHIWFHENIDSIIE